MGEEDRGKEGYNKNLKKQKKNWKVGEFKKDNVKMMSNETIKEIHPP